MPRRDDFPALRQTIRGHALAYLDSASTALKPREVIDAVRNYYERDSANIHRGVHTLSQRATEAFEAARETVAGFLGCVDPQEIIFTRGTTESMNLLAETLGRERVSAGDEVLVSELEHHSNLLPWMRLCEATGARLRVWRLEDDGALSVEALGDLVNPKTKIAAVSHVSNALGTVVPIKALASYVHAFGGIVVVDGAQAVPHLSVDVAGLGADFYAFSGHKLYGPTGAGVLWGRAFYLESMEPWQSGGEMVASVSLSEGVEYADLPHRFEAGTPDIAAVLGLSAAIHWVERTGMDAITAYERQLHAHLVKQLEDAPGVSLIGVAPGRVAVQSMVIDGVHSHDAGTILDSLGIAVRTGHHCAEPVMARFGLGDTLRVSLGVYTTEQEVNRFVEGLQTVRATMHRT